MNYDLIKTTLLDYYEMMGLAMGEAVETRNELDKNVEKYTKLGLKIEDLTANLKQSEERLSSLQQEMMDRIKTIIEAKGSK